MQSSDWRLRWMKLTKEPVCRRWGRRSGRRNRAREISELAMSTTAPLSFSKALNGPPRQRLSDVMPDPRIYSSEPDDEAERRYCRNLMDRIRAFELDPANFFKIGRRR